MHQILSLPILFPILAGAVMLILRPTSRRLRNLLLMASVLLTTAFALTGILLSYRLGGDALSCVLVSFSTWLSISLKIDGLSMVYGTIVAVLWPLITVYSIKYMEHEGQESRFFGFWLIAFGVVNGIAFSQDFLSLYFFYELLTLSTLPLVMHAMDEKAQYAGRKYLIYSILGASLVLLGVFVLSSYVSCFSFVPGGVMNLEKVAGHEGVVLTTVLLMLLGFGAKAIPPFIHCTARILPWRALPVPFCLQGLMPPPRTSLRVRVHLVP